MILWLPLLACNLANHYFGRKPKAKVAINYSSYEGEHHTFQALSLWHQFHFVYRSLAYHVVDDQRQAY